MAQLPNMPFSEPLNIALILGSAPDAVRVKTLDVSNISSVLAINNAWSLRGDWDYLIHPEDFPLEKRPPNKTLAQTIVTAEQYVDIQNQYGGFVYGGGTMAFTAAYWALGALRPDLMLFLGCDMVYEDDGQASHFYGQGNADPLRDDVTLQSLEAKASRLNYFAAQQNCVCLNLSQKPSSRLVFPRLEEGALSKVSWQAHQEHLQKITATHVALQAQACLAMEHEANYYFNSGRYWEHLDQIDGDVLQAIDAKWMACKP
jgi:hypothetical protein